MKRRTQTGRAFCCTSFGLSFLYNISCSHWSCAMLRSPSCLRPLCPFPLKTAATWWRDTATAPSTRGASCGWVNCPSCKATVTFEEKVIAKSDTFAVLGVTIPLLSFIVRCVSTNCYLAGSRCSSEVNHETTLFGSRTILKSCESWQGQWEHSIWVGLLLVLSMSWARTLAVLLSAPQNLML